MSCDINNPDKCYFDGKLQEIDFPYFSFEILMIFSRQLKDKTFSISHLNIRSLSANTDKLRESLASSNGNFNVVVVIVALCNETANKNSLLGIPNFSTLRKTKKIEKVVYANMLSKF